MKIAFTVLCSVVAVVVVFPVVWQTLRPESILGDGEIMKIGEVWMEGRLGGKKKVNL